jgi:transketolase
MTDAVRALLIDTAEHAGIRRPSFALRMADPATTLWTRFHKFDAADPHWPDRDRFVLSAGHSALLLYALLHLTGHDGMAIDDLRALWQLHSPATGHPEHGVHPGIEATTGPCGQGLATAVGMALAERNMAARFGKSLVDHRTWVIACEGDLMEGISHEAASLAGHLALSKLTVLCDDSRSADGVETMTSCSDDVIKRFAAYGWAVKQVDRGDPVQLAAAMSFAVRSKKPTLIACRTLADQGAVEPSGRGAEPFEIPADTAQRWHFAGSRGAAARRGWLKRLARHSLRAEFERVVAGRLPDTWHEAIAALKLDTADQRPRLATHAASQSCLDTLVAAIPELMCGSAGPAPTLPRGISPASASNPGGRYVHYGLREHGMAAAANGMALHGGLVPCVEARLAFSDYLRPALRMGAIMRQRVAYVMTHDSIGLGQDGPAHQPIEQLASIRAMPNVHLYRPADAMETAECWELAIKRADGPSVLVLSHQKLPAFRTDFAENRCARGGYVLAEADGARQATLIATGSEVAIAMTARERLAGQGIAAAVVSLPCWELFALQDEGYRAGVLGSAPRVGIEAAGGFGWDQWLGPEGTFIGMSGYGASAPQEVLYGHFGITAEAAVAAVLRRIG